MAIHGMQALIDVHLKRETLQVFDISNGYNDMSELQPEELQCDEKLDFGNKYIHFIILNGKDTISK